MQSSGQLDGWSIIKSVILIKRAVYCSLVASVVEESIVVLDMAIYFSFCLALSSTCYGVETINVIINTPFSNKYFYFILIHTTNFV